MSFLILIGLILLVYGFIQKSRLLGKDSQNANAYSTEIPLLPCESVLSHRLVDDWIEVKIGADPDCTMSGVSARPRLLLLDAQTGKVHGQVTYP